MESPPPLTRWPLHESFVGADAGLLAGYDAAGSRLVLRIRTGDVSSLYMVELGDDGPGEPWQMVTDLPPTPAVGNGIFVLGETRFAFRGQDPTVDAPALWLSAVDSDGPPTMKLAEPSIPGATLEAPRADSAGDFVVYSEGTSVYDQRAFVIDLTGDPIEPPAPVDAPPGSESMLQIHIAPDSSGFAARQTWLTDAEDIVWIPIEDGAPQPLVQVTNGPLAGRGRGIAGWSSDARWLAVRITGDENNSLYLARQEAGSLGPLMPAAGEGVETSLALEFTPDASAAWVGVRIDDDSVGVHRISLDGDTPGAPQLVSGALKVLVQHGIAADGRSLFYVGVPAGEDEVHAYWVDLSGHTPAEPVRVDSEARLGTVGYAFVSPTGTHMAIWRRIPETQGLYARSIVDTATLVEYPLAGGAPIGVFSMREIP
jgi:hypothetical protein